MRMKSAFSSKYFGRIVHELKLLNDANYDFGNAIQRVFNKHTCICHEVASSKIWSYASVCRLSSREIYPSISITILTAPSS